MPFIKNESQRRTLIFMVVIAVFIAAYDLTTWHVSGVQSTISHLVWQWDQSWAGTRYLVAGLMMLLWWHFFLEKPLDEES